MEKLKKIANAKPTGATGTDRERLSKRLRKRLLDDAAKAYAIGYDAYIFLGMMGEHDEITACINVIMREPPPPGFAKLWEKRHLELTAEAAILDGPWIQLFGDKVIAKARFRLRQYGRNDLAEIGLQSRG